MKKFFKALGAGIGYIAIFIASQAIVSFIMTLYFSFMVAFEATKNGTEISAEKITADLMGKIIDLSSLMTVISGVVALFVVFVMFKIRRKSIIKEVNFKAISLKNVAVLAVMGIALNFIISGVISALPIPESVMESYAQQSSALGNTDLITFLGVVIMAPLTEEVFCRGLMLTRFKRGMPIALAIILQAVIFGLLHGHPLWIAYAAVLGIILGIMADNQNSILASLVLHFTFNLTSFCLGLFEIESESEILAIAIIGVSVIVFVLSFIFMIKNKKSEEIAMVDEI